MYAIINIHSDGFPFYRYRASDPRQPRIVSFCLIALDATLHQTNSIYMLIMPDGVGPNWDVPPKSVGVHGLTGEYLRLHGLSTRHALDVFEASVQDGLIVVAWDARRTLKLLRSEMHRANRDPLFERAPNICLQKACAQVMGKTSNLWEACRYLGIERGEESTAMERAIVSVQILRALRSMEAVPEPAVYYSPNLSGE